MTRRLIPLVALALCACSSGSKSSSQSAATTTSTSAAAVTTAAPPSTTSAAGPSTTASGSGCATPVVTIGAPQGTAGHSNYEIAFRNPSASSCVLSGYPGVSFFDSSGTQIGGPAIRSGLTAAPVVVAPAGSAYAHLAVVDPGVTNCPTASAARVRVYPPGQTTATDVVVGPITICASQYPAATIDPVTSTAP